MRPNETTRLPSCFVYIDTEAVARQTPDGEVQTWSTGVAAHDCVHPNTKEPCETEWGTFDTPLALWEWVCKRTRSRRRTVVVVHNLAYDLRIAQAFTHLPALGWELTGINLAGQRSWAIWRRSEATLTMVDSLSWVPASIEHLGELVGIRKRALPRPTAPVSEWEERARVDVVILRDVWLRVMAWLRDADLGTFKLTGAGQSLAAYRHRFLTHRLLVHKDTEGHVAERKAAWTGRCEAWRHGKLPTGRWDEWDFTCSYASIARDERVPTKLSTHTTRMSPEQLLRLSRPYAVLATVEMATDVPTVPWSDDRGISWPVGTFTTTLWHPEIELAVAHGATFRVLEAWVYQKRTALQAWAEWVLGLIDAPPGEIDEVIRLVAKHWSRALIGRFGMHTSSWTDWGVAPWADVRLSPARDATTGEAFQVLQLGDKLLRSGPSIDAPDAMPQLMGYVMSVARVRLWEAMETAGLDNVAYVDTDALIVNAKGSARLKERRIPDLRVKRSWRTVEVLGPRQLVLGGELRAAGVPRKAAKTGERTYTGEVWRQLSTSLKLGQPDSVVVGQRRYTTNGTDHRREHLAKGRTAPFTVL